MENIDYSQLSAEEYEKIMYVLKRDEKLRRQEEQRLFHLKAELHRLRKRGAIKPGMDQSRVCARCLNELGRLLNRGAICPVCRKTVCKSCRSTSNDENLWLCLVCHKQMQLKAASGEWMREFSRSASEKLRSPSSRSPINHSSSTSGGTESFGKSIKQSLISGFSTSPNTSRTQLCEDYERQPVRQQPQIPYSYVQQTQASIQPQAFVPHPPQPYQMLPTSPQHPPLALHSSCPPYTQQPPSPHHPIPTHQYSAPASFMQPQAPFQPLPPQPFLQQHASFQQQQPLTAFPQTQIHPQSQQPFHNHNHHLPPIPQQSPHHHPSVQPPSQTAPDPPRNPSPKASSTRRQLPPKLPSVDCSARAPLQRSSSNNSSGGSQETSPKPPISPVLKAAYQAAVDLVERKKDSVSPPYNSNLKEPKETVYRKVSTRLQDSSSSEEEEEEEASGAASLYGVKSIDSSPSPRTPNSYKILSSVAHNQATAFKFPPSPYSSRPSSQSRQSSDEISTTFSSLISRSTSSDNNEDPNATSPGNPPNAMARVRRMSMLVKQQAIAEEFNNEISSTVQKLADATNVSRTDSGLSDSNYTSSPRSSSSRAGNRGSGGSEQLFWRTSPKKKNSTGSSGGLGVNDSDDSDDSSENNSSDTVEKTTGYIFRKVTAKRRVSRNETSPENGNQENGSHMRSPSPSIQGNSTRSASGGSSDGNSRGSNSRTSPAKSPTKSPAKTATSLMGDPRSLIGGGPVYKSKSQDDRSLGRKPRPKTRTASGGTICVNSSGVPQISVSDYSESISNRGSSISTTDNNDEDVDSAFAYHSRSQTSLSSFGIRSESMSSIYSAAGGGRYGVVNVTGEILFSLSYNNTSGLMELHIKECRNLAPVDTKRNRSDPYVKVYLLPDRTKAGKRKTKVRKHTLDPVFDEVLRFNLGPFELDKRTLWISVWHSDIFGRNDFLGEVTLPLGRDVFKNTGLRWYPLQDRIEDSDLIYKGDLFLALKFVPADFVGSSKRAKHETRGELHVLVKEAHNLIPTRSNGTSDPFCKCYLLPDKNKTGKQKTPVAKKTCNPKWNYTFVYEDVCLESLKERCLELTVWDYDKLTSNDFLGGVRLSLGTGKSHGKPTEWMDSFGEEVNLWQQMLEKTNMWVYGELRLRPTLQTRH